jgi:hypothetical protein
MSHEGTDVLGSSTNQEPGWSPAKEPGDVSHARKSVMLLDSDFIPQSRGTGTREPFSRQTKSSWTWTITAISVGHSTAAGLSQPAIPSPQFVRQTPSFGNWGRNTGLLFSCSCQGSLHGSPPTIETLSTASSEIRSTMVAVPLNFSEAPPSGLLKVGETVRSSLHFQNEALRNSRERGRSD